jgi:acyl carrier protein
MPLTIEDRLKSLIVETLALEDVDPNSIETDAPLFGEGLGLDSIDALELALAIQTQFGVRTRENDERNREYYHSIKSLADFIRTEQAQASTSGA